MVSVVANAKTTCLILNEPVSSLLSMEVGYWSHFPSSAACQFLLNCAIQCRQIMDEAHRLKSLADSAVGPGPAGSTSATTGGPHFPFSRYIRSQTRLERRTIAGLVGGNHGSPLIRSTWV